MPSIWDDLINQPIYPPPDEYDGASVDDIETLFNADIQALPPAYSPSVQILDLNGVMTGRWRGGAEPRVQRDDRDEDTVEYVMKIPIGVSFSPRAMDADGYLLSRDPDKYGCEYVACIITSQSRYIRRRDIRNTSGGNTE